METQSIHSLVSSFGDVFDSHEHFTEVIKGRFGNRLLGGLVSFLYHHYQKYAVSRFDGLIGITEEMMDAIGGQVRHRSAVGNFVNLTLFERQDRRF